MTPSVVRWLFWFKALVPLLLLILAASYALHWMLARPVGQVSIYGEVRFIDQQALQERSLPWLQEAFWRVDLGGLSRALEEDPWLRQASVTRHWPNEIAIHLEEREAWARWNDEALLDPQGEAFYPANAAAQDLPLHFFSEADALQETLVFYRHLDEVLKPLGLQVSQLQLEPRGAWRLKLDTGVTLMLGRDNIEKRMNRFLWVWSQWSEEQQARVKTLDARYPNGLAVGWDDGPG